MRSVPAFSAELRGDSDGGQTGPRRKTHLMFYRMSGSSLKETGKRVQMSEVKRTEAMPLVVLSSGDIAGNGTETLCVVTLREIEA